MGLFDKKEDVRPATTTDAPVVVTNTPVVEAPVVVNDTSAKFTVRDNFIGIKCYVPHDNINSCVVCHGTDWVALPPEALAGVVNAAFEVYEEDGSSSSLESLEAALRAVPMLF